jgi:hypothetical protein
MHMDMRTWRAETQRATASLIPLVWADQEEFEQAMRRYQELTAATEAGYRQAAAFQEDFDDDGLATAIHWDTYFGVDKDRHHAGIEAENLSAKLEAWAFARASLASAILQIAKQGISAVRGQLAEASPGRELYGVPIRDVSGACRPPCA